MAGLVVFLSACEGPAFFSASLSEPGGAPVDESIVGSWYLRTSKGETLSLNVMRVGDNRLGAILNFMNADAGSEKEFHTRNYSYYMIAHPSELNGERYYNVTVTGAANFKEFLNPETLGNLAGFMIHKVTVIDDEWLLVYSIMEDSPEELVGWSESNSRRVKKTAKYKVSRGDLRGLLSAVEPQELFNPFLFLRRVPVLEEESLPPEIRNESDWKL